ncbi:MAG TPA: SDR family NAD(P)-dependent oxidoreductase, partial [bacterium]|nr:SDR family NAD(P)-dependent oxidoreductase [bacterium]
MNLSGCTALITGGGTGIGLALAEALMKEGSQVLVCGRREEPLVQAQERFPGLEYKVCDLADSADREALFEWVRLKHPGMDLLINNAGVQRDINFRKGLEELENGENEVLVNLEAAIYLTAQFMPLLLARDEAAIVNVSSGLAFVPLAAAPVYCATKAGLHSFSQSLRHQLSGTSVKVFELIPPAVDTELGQGARARRGETDRGIPAAEVAAAAV